jgi:hypothetical protein
MKKIYLLRGLLWMAGLHTALAQEVSCGEKSPMIPGLVYLV